MHALFGVLVSFCLAASLAAPASANLTYGVSGSPYGPGIGQLAAHNIAAFRQDAPWALIEPQAPPAPFRFSGTDAMVRGLAAEGLAWLPIADTTPTWQRPLRAGQFSLPASPAAYGRFVQAIVARYGPSGSFWKSNPQVAYHPVQAVEVWNEENTARFLGPQGRQTPGRFYDLYAAARRGVHAIARTVKVIFGGVLDSAPNPIPWLKRMQAERPGSLGRLDALGWHPYLYSLALTIQHLRRLRALLDASAAARVPISITEVGDNTAFSSPQQWTSLLGQLTSGVRRSGCRVDMLVPYVWQGTAQTTAVGGWYSLSEPTGELTAAGKAFTAATAVSVSRRTSWCKGLRPRLQPISRKHPL